MRRNLKTCCKRILPAFIFACTMFYLGILTVQNHMSYKETRRMHRGGPWMVFVGQEKKGDGGGMKRLKETEVLEESLSETQPKKLRDNLHPLRPHILFITVAGLGWNDVGYNNPVVKTPAIDRLAGAGVRLENYYVQNRGAPSKAEILTGKFQTHNGVNNNIHPSETFCLPSNKVTMSRVLKDAGYSTHMVGQWGLGHSKRECTPTFRGYDTFYGSLTGFSDHFTHQVHWTPRHSKAKQLTGYDFYENERPAFEVRNQYSSYLLAKRALKIISEHKDSNEPLFLDLSFPAPNAPSEVPRKFEYIYRDIEDVRRRQYLGMVSYIDEAINNVTKALKTQNMWRNSVIVFSSVSGGDPSEGGSNWPLRGWGGSYWEGGIRAVSFIHTTHLRPDARGTECNVLLSSVDWFPTLAGFLAGGKISALYLDGINIWGIINKVAKISPRRGIIHSVAGDCHLSTQENLTSELIQSRIHHGTIRLRDWKLVVNYPGEAKYSFDWVPPAEMHLPMPQFKRPHYTKTIWLFRISEDPVEKRNMVDLRTDITEKLLQNLWDYCVSAVDVRTRFDDPYADPGLHGGVVGPWIL